MENGQPVGENKWSFDVPLDQSVQVIPPVKSESSVRVVIPPTELTDIGEKQWENAVVVQFVGCIPIPDFSALKKASNRLWGNESVVDLKPVGSNLFLINFLSSEVRDDVIEGSPWDVQNAPLIVRRWKPEMEGLELMDKVPVWILLSNIPLELFHPKGIEYIANIIGIPLYTDRITARQQRLDFAKVCIEIEAKVSVPNEIEVVLKSGKHVKVKVTVPWMPLSCTDCNIFGHDDRNCPRNNKAAAVVVSHKRVPKKNETMDSGDKGKEKGKGKGKAADMEIQISNEAKKMVEGEKTGIEERLNVVVGRIMSWDSGLVHDLNIDVDEARKLIERLNSQSLNREKAKRVLRRAEAHDVVQMTMQRLEEKFKHILVQHRQPFEPERYTSFRSNKEDKESFDVLHLEEYIIDLVHPDVIPCLKGIANLIMFTSNPRDFKCRRAYVNVRKDALEECIFNLEMEKLSIKEVCLHLVSEKSLCDKIFGDQLGSISANLECFVEVAKAPMLQLLNFDRAISIDFHKPENLIPILCMYKVLAGLVPDIDALVLDNAGSCVIIEYHKVLKRIGDIARASFLEFEYSVESNTSTSPSAGMDAHCFTSYVMNKILCLVDYKDTLNLLLKDQDGVAATASASASATPDMINKDLFSGFSPMEYHFQLLASILETNIYNKSKLQRDASSQHFFMMNNIHDMTEKVKKSELRLIFGDNWIRRCNRKVQQHAMEYERATWCPILSILKDVDRNSSPRTLQERLQRFYVAFEKVYKTQTAWLIPDAELREDLRILISIKVIQAYRTFVGRQMYHIDLEHIKYNAEDMQDYFFDLFEGSQKIIA